MGARNDRRSQANLGNSNALNLHIERLQHGIRIPIDKDLVRLERRNLRNIVILPLPLFFLQLERDTADRTLLDTLHQVCGEARNLVAQALCRDQSHFVADALVGLEVQRETRVVLFDDDARCLLDSLGTDTALRYHVMMRFCVRVFDGLAYHVVLSKSQCAPFVHEEIFISVG